MVAWLFVEWSVRPFKVKNNKIHPLSGLWALYFVNKLLCFPAQMPYPARLSSRESEVKQEIDVTHLFAFERQLDKNLLKFLVDKIDAKLFKTVGLNKAQTSSIYVTFKLRRKIKMAGERTSRDFCRYLLFISWFIGLWITRNLLHKWDPVYTVPFS